MDFDTCEPSDREAEVLAKYGHLIQKRVVPHVGTQQRWVPLIIETGERNFEGHEYVRWVCSCGEASEPFIDKDEECESDFRRHEREVAA